MVSSFCSNEAAFIHFKRSSTIDKALNKYNRSILKHQEMKEKQLEGAKKFREEKQTNNVKVKRRHAVS